MATSGSHGGDFVPVGPAHNYEYEPDKFAVKTILAVPAAVIITGLVAFTITWTLFESVFDPAMKEPAEVQAAVDRNNAPLNERLSRISSTDPKAEVQQPRLEGMQVTEVYKRDTGYQITAEMSTTKPKAEGNSPRFHAPDLRPEKQKELIASGADKATGAIRVPVDEAIKLLVDGKLLQTQTGAARLEIDPDWNRPKESNGGNAKTPEAPKPAAKKAAEEKKASEPEKK
jgi:hypothetical protein